MLQPIHLYNLEPIICDSKKVPCLALLKFRTYFCAPCSAYSNFVLTFVSKQRRYLRLQSVRYTYTTYF